MMDIVNILNRAGDGFCGFALAMLIQSGILIVLLYLIDLLIRKHVRAVFRYCIWMLVFAKLLLPPALCLPTGIGYWCGPDVSPPASQTQGQPPADAATFESLPAWQPAASFDIQRPIAAADPQTAYTAPLETTTGAEVQEEPVIASVPATAPIETIAITWQAVVFLIWLVGVLVLSVLLFQRFLFVKSLLAQSGKANGRLDETLQQCGRQVGLRRNIELRLSKNMLSPAACGLSKPIILMPASLLDDLSEEKLRAVLIHELAHIKRGDLWVNFIQTILQIIYFYNPLLWFANAVVRGLREKAVDEMVLTKLGDEAKSYSNTLIDIAEIAFSKPHFSLRLVGVVESKKALTSRIKHILSRPFPKSAKLGLLGLTAIVIAAAVLLPMANGVKTDGYKPKKVPYKKELSSLESVSLKRIRSDGRRTSMNSGGGGLNYTGGTLQDILAVVGGHNKLLPILEVVDLPDGYYEIHVPDDGGSVAEKICTVFSRAFDLGVSIRSIETDVYVLTCPDSAAVTIRKSNETRARGFYKHTKNGKTGSITDFIDTVDSIAIVAGYFTRKTFTDRGKHELRHTAFVNETGLDGRYEGKIKWNLRDSNVIMNSLRSMGFTITKGKRVIEAIVVEKTQNTNFTVPLPKLTAHKYYKAGEPIQIEMKSAGGVGWKPALDEIYCDDDHNPLFVLIDGKEYGSRSGVGPFGGGTQWLTASGMTYENVKFPAGKYRFAYGWKGIDVVNPDAPEEVMHFDRLMTNEVEFEVVDELPDGYFKEVYQDGWDDTLGTNIEPRFTDDWQSVGAAGSLLTLKVKSLPFDIAFDIYAQAEGSEESEPAGQIAIKANPTTNYRQGIKIKGLTWDNVGERRWRLILKPSQKVASEHPAIRHYYGREYMTDWLTFERSEHFETHKKMMTRERRQGYGGTIKSDKPVDLDILGRRIKGDNPRTWPLSDGFDLGWSEENGGTLRINPDSNVRMLWLPDANASLVEAKAETAARLSELAYSTTSEIIPPTGQRTLVAVRSSKGKVYFVTVKKVNTQWANLSWYEAEATTEKGRFDKNWTYNLSGPDSLAFGSKRARIVDSQGKGVSGAVIEFDQEAKVKDINGKAVKRHPLRGGRVITDSQGRFPMPSLDSVVSAHGKLISFDATITADGFIKRLVPFTMSGDYPQGKGEIDLLRPSTVQGTLIGPDGKPVANATLMLITEISYTFPYCGESSILRASTDEQGHFKIENVPPGLHLLSYPERHMESRASDLPVDNICGAVKLTVEDGMNIDDMVLDLSRSTCVITGKILDKKGRPIKGALANVIVELNIVRDDGSYNGITTTFYSSEPTDINGTYVLNLPPGDWFINASYPYVKGQKQISSSNTKIHLSPDQTIHRGMTLKRQDISKHKPAVPVEGEGKKAEEIDKKTTTSSPFTATVPNGVTVELIGICEYPSEGKQWWRPDGSLLKVRPYDKLNDREAYGDLRMFEVVFRLNPSKNTICKINRTDKIPGFFGPYPISRETEGVSGNLKNALYAFIPVKGTDDQVDLSFACGTESDWQWLLRAESPVDRSGMNTDNANISVSVGQNKRIIAHVTHKISDAEIRVIARDRSGLLHRPISVKGKGMEWVRVITAEFDLSVDDAAVVEVQTQKFQSITFKNVSLRPGVKTEVKAALPPVPLETEVNTGETPSPPWLEERTVNFPADRSVGMLKTRKLNPVAREPDEDLAEARGKVHIPADHLLGLEFARDKPVDLSPLANLKPTDLQNLYLYRTKVQDADLQHISRLTGLRELGLGMTNIGDEGLAHIASLKSLKELNIAQTKVSDAGLIHLAKLSELETLSLRDNSITNKGLIQLRGLKKLKHLILTNTKITDQGLFHLNRMNSLISLTLSNNDINDKGLEHLAGLSKLKYLNLKRTSVSKTALKTLMQALPNCRITHSEIQRLADTLNSDSVEAPAVQVEGEIINRKNVRGILSQLAKRPEYIDPKIPNDIKEQLLSGIPGSFDAILSVMENPDDKLHRQAVLTLVHLWENLSPEQMDKFFKLSITVEITSRKQYPQGIKTGVGAYHKNYYSQDGWPGIKEIKMHTVSRRYLDGAVSGRIINHEGRYCGFGWVPIGDLEIGKHTMQAKTEYTINYKGRTYSGKAESELVEFEILKEMPNKLAAPYSKDIEEKVKRCLTFKEIRKPENQMMLNWDHSGWYQDPWQPQMSSGRREGYDEYAVHLPLYSLSELLDVDLCFDVDVVIEETGEKFTCDQLIILKGEKCEGIWISMHQDLKGFVKGRKDFVPVKVVLTPSYKTALADMRIKKYYNSSITSQTLRARVFHFDLASAEPWEKELYEMFNALESKDKIDKQLFYKLHAMGSLNPYYRRDGSSFAMGQNVSKDIGLAIPFLVKLLNGADAKIIDGAESQIERYTAYQAGEGLGNIGKRAVPELIKSLKENNDSGRALAADALGKIGDSRAYEPLIELLKDPGPKSRRVASRILGKFKNPGSVELLIELLKDADSQVRKGAAVSLVTIGDSRAAKPLIGCLDDTNYQVRQAAVEGIGAMQPKESVELLVERLKNDENNIVRRVVVETLAKIGDSGVIVIEGLIEAVLTDKSSTVRRVAVNALYSIRGEHALETIIKCLDDPDHQVRMAAAKSLGQIDDPAGVGALIKSLKDENRHVRFAVVRALGRSGTAAAVEPLIEALKDEYAPVRKRAIRMLGNIGDRRAVAPAIKLLKDTNSGVRYHAAESLGKLKDPKAVDALKAALNDKILNVRSAAKTAIKKIKDAQKKDKNKPDMQVEAEEGWGQAIDGVRVGISMKKTSFAMDEPIQVQWRIKNVSQENKRIVWHKLQYSPVVFEIGKSGGKKYIRTDSRRMFSSAHPEPPEELILIPGETKEAIFDLRFFDLGSYAERGTYEVTGLYSPQKAKHLADYWLKRPELKDCYTGQISSATLKFTLTDGKPEEVISDYLKLPHPANDKGREIANEV